LNLYLKIILILFGLAYLISPMDIIPDWLLPFFGFIDDGVIIGTIYYLIRYGKLPNFFFKKKNPFNQPFKSNNSNFNNSKTSGHNNTYQQDNKTRASNSNTRTNPKTKSKSVPTPHEILGISPNASKKEIQNAYKQSIKKYHPDKLSHLGKDFSNLANEKFLEIQRAYDTLMEKYKT